jgi:hypothetical protein
MFDKKAHIAKMQVPVDRLLAQMRKHDVDFKMTDGDMDNIVMTYTKTGKVVRISHHSFYRYSGIAFVTKEGKEKNSSEWVEVNDEMFMQTFMKLIIEVLLDIKK